MKEIPSINTNISHNENKPIPCNVCGEKRFYTLFEKESALKEKFRIVKCKNCGLAQVNPQPQPVDLQKYYRSSYFTQRTDRGYDNYFSEKIRSSVERVFELNLIDLDFFSFEKSVLKTKPKALDIGCAAGYFVNFLKNRGWDSMGIEISESAASFGIEKLGLNIIIGDFLSSKELASQSYDFITLWASLEHMPDPVGVMKHAYELLKPGGRMILSTCNYGILAKMRGKKWRYMNVPEHLYFFSLKGLILMSESIGFKVVSHITYGSGMTSKKGASLLYRNSKRMADHFVKATGIGDMMALHLAK